MRVGIYQDLRNPPEWRKPWDRFYAESIEVVEEAERLGADSVWISEHHFFEDGYLPQPLTYAAALAARTERLRIGTAVLLAPFRQAIDIAEQTAIVDLVSGGRFDLGLGAGYRVPEFAAYQTPMEDRFKVVRERASEIREIFAKGLVTPGPLQDPFPIWCGFATPTGARHAGRLGVGLLSVGRELAVAYQRGLEEAGFPAQRARMAGPVHFILADDPEEVWHRVTPHFRYQCDSYRRYMVEGSSLKAPRPIDPEKWRQPGPDGAPPQIGVFTPAAAAAMIREWLAGTPAVEIYFWSSIAGMPEDLARRHVELVCTELRVALADFAPAESAG
ncbi:MAG: LLM class flavin-dependent oxidoreductase [Deltaproteobacteria bacterium]|nr:LLM class flavin-dependent oxidoreductase [Deltaproteobacteria bacterium]